MISRSNFLRLVEIQSSVDSNSCGRTSSQSHHAQAHFHHRRSERCGKDLLCMTDDRPRDPLSQCGQYRSQTLSRSALIRGDPSWPSHVRRGAEAPGARRGVCSGDDTQVGGSMRKRSRSGKPEASPWDWHASNCLMPIQQQSTAWPNVFSRAGTPFL